VSPRIITVPEADGIEITIQSLVNQIRAWEDDQSNLCYPSLLSASGKEVLDAETLVGITAQLLNAKVKFADRTIPTDCNIYGGNLVAIDADGYPMNAIQHAENITVTIAKSSSATLIQLPIIEEIQYGVAEVQYQVANVQETVDAQPTVLAEVHGYGSWEKPVEFKKE